MAMLSHVPGGHATMQHSEQGIQHVAVVQEDCSGVDCGGMLLHMSSCDLACQPMVSPISNKNIKIRIANSFQLSESNTFIAFSPESIERPPKHSV